MPKEIFPLDNEEYLLETFWAKNSIKSQAIYVTILLLLFGSFIVTFFVKVNVTVHGPGIIRPELEKTEIKTLCSGVVNWVGIKEGEFVYKNQDLITIDSEDLSSRLQLVRYQIKLLETYIRDLEYLTKLDFNKLFSEVYDKELASFKQKLQANQNKQEKAKRELERNKLLFKSGVIAEKEYDDLKYQLSVLEKEYNTIMGDRLSAWQSRLETYKREIKEYENQNVSLLKEMEKHKIISPVAGYIEHFKGIVEGVNVQAGQTIAVVSPDTGLIAEIYIAPKDIGMINIKQNVLIQVDAFNYNQWGILSGKVDEISRDFILLNNQPVFRVRCRFDKNFLTLRNGFKGYLKKGMTIRARFLVTERTLFQLLFDKVDNWLNPATN